MAGNVVSELVHLAMDAEGSYTSVPTIIAEEEEEEDETKRGATVEALELQAACTIKEDEPNLEYTAWYNKKLVFPRDMSILTYSMTIVFGAMVACAISFTLLPISNPLHSPDMKGWWMCPLTCTLVWVPLSTLYISELLDLLVLAESGKHLRVIDLIALWAITAGTIDVIYTVFSFYILYPFPMISVFEAPLAFMLSAIYLYKYTLPRIAEGMREEERSAMFNKAMYVLGFYEWSLCQLQVLLIVTGLLNNTCGSLLSGMIVALIGEFCNTFSAWLAHKVDPRAEVLGLNVSMVTFGIVQSQLAGDVGTITFILAMLAVDFMFALPSALEIIQFKIGNYQIGRMLMFKALIIKRLFKGERPLLHHVAHHEIKQKIVDERKSLLAMEAAELIVPLAYVLSWVVIYFGPNGKSFAGVRTSEFGLAAPKNPEVFLQSVGLVVVFEFISFMFFHVLLKHYSPEGLLDEAAFFLHRYGTVLAVQSIFILQSSIMHSMISCGIDFSWKFDYVAAQWPQHFFGQQLANFGLGAT